MSKCKTKKQFFKYCLHFFSSEKVLQDHKENCLITNGKQTVKLKSGSINFKSHFKQLAVSFKMYADFKCNVKGFKSIDKNNSSNTEKHQDRIPCSLASKVVCIDNKSSKSVVLYRGKNAVYRFIEATLIERSYCK